MADLALDGLFGAQTLAVLRSFQLNHIGFYDDLVEPGRNTIGYLEARIDTLATELFAFSAIALTLSYQAPETEELELEPILSSGEMEQFYAAIAAVG